MLIYKVSNMDKIEELLTRGVDKIYPSKEALEKVLRSGKKLRLYTGIDPTGTQIHIGHTVWMWKLRAFQDAGHEVIVLIGDFTGMIGDPSGKSEARKPLTREQVLKNAKTYKEQIGKIIRFEGKNAAKIKFNSEWLAKLSVIEVGRLMSQVTYSQIIERDMFQKRLEEGKDLFVSELFYPLLQGYDSVAMDVDLEVGGSDQLFNMLMGRDLMKKMKQKEKFVITLQILADSSGKKIGKTEGNAIAITGKPDVLYGQIMSLPDETIISLFECATNVPWQKVMEIKSRLSSGENPMQLKKELAWQIVSQYNNQQTAHIAQEYFEKTFQKKDLTAEIPVVHIKFIKDITVIDLLSELKLVKSRGEAKRLILEKAVEINGEKVTDPQQKVSPKEGMIIRVGKHRFAKIEK